MTINGIQFVIAAILIVAGIIIMAIQTFAVFRFDYVLNRMHGAAMGDSLGMLLIIIGLLVIYGLSFSSMKLIAIIVVFWFASPVCSHLLSKLEVNTNEHLEENCEVPEE